MDVIHHLNGTRFVWNADKAQRNVDKHGGIHFEHAAEVFFDPFIRLIDASRLDENRDAVIGFDMQGRLLFVVHVLFEDDCIRIISARRATTEERTFYDS